MTSGERQGKTGFKEKRMIKPGDYLKSETGDGGEMSTEDGTQRGVKAEVKDSRRGPGSLHTHRSLCLQKPAFQWLQSGS